ncbi:unnamed protein product [Sphenostylis stenocarpa]|uniref:Uncharacterized protein n=1 Tax=Sphenostylis stenocarpa TaxID=92480 RepID=A0AA86RQL9_9FABA|nr:unnamed protein product [Sphenostylis stenocarpa]
MAVVAVSGSMAFVVHQVHKRLLSSFMEEFEFEMREGLEKHQSKKKVRFSKESLEERSCGGGNRMITTRVGRIKAEEIWKMKNVERDGSKLENMMPPNRRRFEPPPKDIMIVKVANLRGAGSPIPSSDFV